MKIFINLLSEKHVQSLRLIARFQNSHRMKQKTLLNTFHLTRPKMRLNIRLSFTIAHGKKITRFIRNCVSVI